ncbi:MAG: PD40 domain-containing protein [Flavobacteriales bacterium]|nr:PD40 domain-containing protein [Flavobacteriales bacterium]
MLASFRLRTPRLPGFLVALCIAMAGSAQFYSGSRQEYGKNRVQYQEFLWQQYRFKDMEVFFYKEGRDLAKYTAQAATIHLKDLEKEFDFAIDERLQFIVYNSLTDFRQSNIGIAGVDGEQNIGGLTRIVGTKIFVYFEGDHTLLDRQIRSGIAHVIIDQMMFGGNWRDMLKSSTFMSLPTWYTDGIMSYHSQPWDATLNNRIRDGVMSGRYDKFNRLEGDDPKYAGHMIWKYVADVYGPGVIPNILYMTRVSRNPESGFLFVLGVSLKTLTQECLAYNRGRFTEEDRTRKDIPFEALPIKTRKTRTYSEFKQSPNGRYLAWVSNELGQYKVWVYEIATKKLRRIVKGEKKLDRIVDRSFPVLAWHPTSQALSYALERRGELFLRTYTLDDGKTTEKPVLMLKKILSMAYSDDGRNIVFSAVRDGRTDLYYYYVIGNRQEQLTDDQYDDLDPHFVDGGRRIIFSSDRPDDTLRTNADVALVNGSKDIFLLDVENRSRLLTRLTSTPGVNEVQPTQYDSSNYAYLSEADGIRNRFLVRYDSAVSRIDTVVHYRYFTVQERKTDLRRSILEQDVNARYGRYTQLQYRDGRYHFYAARTFDDRSAGTDGGEGDDPQARDAANPTSLSNDMSPVVKIDPQFPRPKGEGAIDVRNYVFLDEVGVAAKPEKPEKPATKTGTPTTPTAVADTAVAKPFTFPDQRNYNLNFAIDGVVTQVDNSFSSQFYQPFTGPNALNPGLSALTRMGISDLFEDHKIVGGFRLALDLNNNDYLLAYENLKRRMDKRISFQRQAYQGFSDFGVVKVHTHNVRYQVSWPFSELASLRASVMYRNDRYVLQSIDPLSLRTPNEYDHMGGGKLEYVYDSSMPRGLNLWTGWKLKFFAEYYQQPKDKSDMEVVGMDLRHSLRVHREMIWVTRLAGSGSFGSRKIAYFLGGVDNWLFAKVDNSIPIDFSQNYFYQSMSVPMRGFFYNARNGSSFGVFNSELRLPLFRYLVNRPIRSDFLHNFQVIGFTDVGAAWTGSDPYSEDNSFNRVVIQRNPLTITLVSKREPIVAAYGFGLRTRLLGYFVRADWAWGVDDGVILPQVFHFSLSLDI